MNIFLRTAYLIQIKTQLFKEVLLLFVTTKLIENKLLYCIFLGFRYF